MEHDVIDALEAEQEALRVVVEQLDDQALARPSRCEGWSVADVLLHLAQTNELAAASAAGELESAMRSVPSVPGASDVDSWAAEAVEAERPDSAREARDRWLHSATAQVHAFRSVDGSQRVLWVSGELAARSLATTRLAETWIHSNDITTALGIETQPTERLWHIARLAHRTLPYAFDRAGGELGGAVAFVLDAPDGTRWTFGDPGAPTVINGPALQLCELAGQRSTAGQTDLAGSGPDADGTLRFVRTFA
ncbi:MAG: maleylpyruvate isomerase family mycothiol-dependent enzyme [Microthrixaceae bacterium]